MIVMLWMSILQILPGVQKKQPDSGQQRENTVLQSSVRMQDRPAPCDSVHPLLLLLLPLLPLLPAPVTYTSKRTSDDDPQCQHHHHLSTQTEHDESRSVRGQRPGKHRSGGNRRVVADLRSAVRPCSPH